MSWAGPKQIWTHHVGSLGEQVLDETPELLEEVGEGARPHLVLRLVGRDGRGAAAVHRDALAPTPQLEAQPPQLVVDLYHLLRQVLQEERRRHSDFEAREHYCIVSNEDHPHFLRASILNAYIFPFKM